MTAIRQKTSDRSYPGIFITFEGGEGVGKSTHAKRLVARLERMGYSTCYIHEPGSTVLGESVRALLLDPANTAMSARTELLLYEAARAQVIDEVIRPALEAGTIVVCDRFVDSTLAYQGYARGLGCALVEQANALAIAGIMPDRTILLLRDVAEGLKRARSKGVDRLEAESLDFHHRVQEGFVALARADGGNRIRTIRCLEDIDQVEEQIFSMLCDLL
jgi:dTMP kinase